MQTYFILEDGGMMTKIELQRHKKTVSYYNNLVDRIAGLKKDTEEYLRLRSRIVRSMEYYKNDLIKAQKTAKLLKAN